MEIIFFTKFLAGLEIERIGGLSKETGFDGLDLAVRPGQCVNPENARDDLPKAVSILNRMGLTVPLVSLDVTTTDPDCDKIKGIYRACDQVGVRFIKIGYWLWQPEGHYWTMVARIRNELKKFKSISKQNNICTLIHIHSDNCYGCNAAGVMDLVKDVDPEHIAVYLDPAHLAFDGENLPMALDILRGHIKMVGVKNAGYQCTNIAIPKMWKPCLPMLSEGLVNWSEAIKAIKACGYEGPLSYHGEIDGYLSREKIMEGAAIDLKYLRKITSDI